VFEVSLEKIAQPGEFNDLFNGQDGAHKVLLRSGVDFIQMMLGCRLGHELPYAFVKSAISYQIRSGAKSGANSFIVERRPFPENCRSRKIDLSVVIIHLNVSPFVFLLGLAKWV
jgi:hypothetical protein